MTVKELREAVIKAATVHHFNVGVSYTEEVPEISGKRVTIGWKPTNCGESIGVTFYGRTVRMGEFSPDEFREMAAEIQCMAELVDELNAAHLSYTLASVRLAYSD